MRNCNDYKLVGDALQLYMCDCIISYNAQIVVYTCKLFIFLQSSKVQSRSRQHLTSSLAAQK